MIRASIPSYHPVEEEHGRSYTVFLIEFCELGRFHRVEKRYRAFHSLHKQLKKVVETPEFPPKRVRNWNSRVLEHRRKGLEQYLQAVLKLNPIPKTVLSFLGIQAVSRNGSSESLPGANAASMSHQPVVTFVTDPFVSPNVSGSLTNMVVKGVMNGLYENSWQDMHDQRNQRDDNED